MNRKRVRAAPGRLGSPGRLRVVRRSFAGRRVVVRGSRRVRNGPPNARTTPSHRWTRVRRIGEGETGLEPDPTFPAQRWIRVRRMGEEVTDPMVGPDAPTHPSTRVQNEPNAATSSA